MWANPLGVGLPGVNMDNKKTWYVPAPALPLVGPGIPLKI